jgi:hypothetical protein
MSGSGGIAPPFSTSAALPPERSPPVPTGSQAGWGPRTVVDAVEKKKIPCHCRESNPGRPARCYINWAITAPLEDSNLYEVEKLWKQAAVVMSALVWEIFWRKRIPLGLKCRKHGWEQNAYREVSALFVANCCLSLSRKEWQGKWMRPCLLPPWNCSTQERELLKECVFLRTQGKSHRVCEINLPSNLRISLCLT